MQGVKGTRALHAQPGRFSSRSLSGFMKKSIHFSSVVICCCCDVAAAARRGGEAEGGGKASQGASSGAAAPSAAAPASRGGSVERTREMLAATIFMALRFWPVSLSSHRSTFSRPWIQQEATVMVSGWWNAGDCWHM